MTAGAIHSPPQPPSRERVELILSRLDQLPTIPAVAARLLAVTTADDSSVQDVVDIVESDAALTAVILRLLRRADLGIRKETVTVRRAVTLLGFRAVRNAVLAVQLFETFPPADDREQVAATRRGLWEHSLAVACMGEMLGERLGGARLAGEAFVCGLLHDVGKLALDACLPKSYARAVDRSERQGLCICDAENDVFGMNHTVAGKRLAARWQLPPAVVECVWLHHQDPDALPSSVAFPLLVKIVHAADHLVRRQGIGFSGYQYACDFGQLSTTLAIHEADLDVMVGHLPERMSAYRESLHLDESNGDDYAASLAQANRHLVQANSRLAESNRLLSVRSACLSAMERFTQKLGDGSTIGDICLAACESVCGLLGAETSVAFPPAEGRRCVHVGFTTFRDQPGSTTAIDRGEDEESAAGPPSIPPLPGFAAAPNDCEWLWRTCGLPEARDPLWVLPLIAENSAIGAVIVAAPAESVRRFQDAAPDCAALAQTIALAMRSAAVSADAERMNEELLDVNRRLREAQRELVRTRSISMIAAMAAGAAHELNNPLSVISGRAQMAAGQTKDEQASCTLTIISEQAQRASDIVTDLMHFAKPKPPEATTTRLKDLLDPLYQRWQSEFRLKQGQLALSLADPEATVHADSAQIGEVLTALVANAVEATRGKTARLQINSPSRASDETVRMVVADNGVGMSREVLEHALDPFFSHRPAGRGRGLGLSRAYRLVEINGGRLWLESTENVGTRVTIELPARGPATHRP